MINLVMPLVRTSIKFFMTLPQMNILDAVYDWLSPIQEMDEEGFQAFVEGISTKSWSRILKIVNARG